MAALLRGLWVGRALRGLGSVVAAPCTTTVTTHRCNTLRRGLYSSALRLQGDSKADKTSSSAAAPSPTNFHENYRAHAAGGQDTTTAAGSLQEEASADPATEPEEASTSYQDQSGEQEEEYETEEQLRGRILMAALGFVPLHGWTMEAIAAGAETLGLSSASTGMFNNGAGDLVLHFIAHCNSQLTEMLAEQHKQVRLGHAEPKETADFLRDAVETRLRMHILYIEKWPQVMTILLLPHNLRGGLKHLSDLVDDIWYYAGDRSTDMSWYTKRAALTGIYKTTELVMLRDSSPDFQDTWNFLDNRIQDINNMASTAKRVQETGEAVVQGLIGAAVTLKNLAGINQRQRR